MPFPKITTLKWDEFTNIVDGQPRNSKEKHYGIDPTTDEKLWPVPVGTQQDVDDAVVSARRAFKKWSRTPVERRKELLEGFKEAYIAHFEEMINLLSYETGKPRAVAEFEANAVPFWFDAHLEMDLPEVREEDHDKVMLTRYTPLGVVGAICPWNMPIALCVGKIIPALLTGNTIIVKPSPYTPYTTLKLVEIAQSIFEPGVVQAIGGSDMLGPMLTAHPDIAKISFTGSTATGKKIIAACAATLKRCTLELGGNDASIVLPDVDVKKVAPELVTGAFQNSGQICVATKRIYIHEDIYAEMLQEMVKVTQTFHAGIPGSGSGDSGTLLGPVQNKMQYEKVKGFFTDAKEKGYEFAAGHPDVADGKGFYIQPSIIDNPPDDSRIVREEPFGPIVPVLKWTDEEQVIERANDTLDGLGSNLTAIL